VIIAGLLAGAAPAGAMTPVETVKAMAAHAQSFQLWIRERYPRPPVSQEQLLDLPRPDVSVSCGRAGCRNQLKALDPLFDAAKALAACRGFPSYGAQRLMDGRGAALGVVYITSAQPTFFEFDGVCYETKCELYFDGGDVFSGLFRWVK
jgi:hypothetical protein